jgi:hypothetical protein
VGAQQAERVRRIGLLMGMTDDREGQARVTTLKQGLQELGWTDGRNIQVETRFAGADAGRIRTHVAELVALAPDVIVGQTTPVIRALRQATSSIPIVMAAINDPVDQGFVSGLAHPGGNITGFTFVDFQMVGKWLEILKEESLAPAAWLPCALDRRLASASVSSKAIIAILSKTRPITRMVLLPVHLLCGQRYARCSRADLRAPNGVRGPRVDRWIRDTEGGLFYKGRKCREFTDDEY